MGLCLEEKDNRIILKIKVSPKASSNSIKGLFGDALKVFITAPPVDGAANKACIKFLAKTLKVKKSDISIISGETSRNKTLSITCENTGKLKTRILGLAK